MERCRVSYGNNHTTWNSVKGARKEEGVIEEKGKCVYVCARVCMRMCVLAGALTKARPFVAFHSLAPWLQVSRTQ